MKILIAPDSYKGSLTAKEVCACIEAGFRRAGNFDLTAIPLSDGGEGFAETLSDICGGSAHYADCSDIYGRHMKGRVFTVGETAIINTSEASGLQSRKDVMAASSYGTGELINYAVSIGCSDIILGLGGTGCCDGGAGALAALGAVFRNISGELIERPCGGILNSIYGASYQEMIKDISFTFACDVDNTLFGKNGAAYVFAAQKGANEKQVKELDNGLRMVNAFLPRDVRRVKGAGAAGGICAGLYGVYGGEIKSGFEIIAERCGLEKSIAESDLVITGEGKTDRQTLMGKLPFKISELCKKHGKSCVIISGKCEDVQLADRQISLADGEITVDEAISNAAQILADKAERLARELA